MQVHIKNFRGLTEAQFDLGNITIIGGENGSGKSSTAQAVTAALTGEAPIPNLKKQQYQRLVRIGAAGTWIEIKTPDGRAIMTYPDGKAYTEGKPPRSSVYATGLASPLEMSAKEAAEAWALILDTEPTLEHLEQALKAQALDDIGTITATVRARGWDGAHAQYKEDGARHKGRWEQITGERYGKTKAEGWSPHPLPPGSTREQLEQAVQAAKTTHDKAIASMALADDERDKLLFAANTLASRRDTLSGAETAFKDAQAAYGKEHDLYREMPVPDEAPLRCPHCSKPVRLRSGKLFAADMGEHISREEHKAAAARCEDLKAKMNAVAETVMQARSLVAQSESAIAKLNENEGKITVDTQATAAALDDAQKVLKHWTAVQDARAAHETVLRHVVIVDILAPEGLRKRQLDAAITAFNTALQGLTGASKWPRISVEPDLNVSFDGRPYTLLSESEAYRVRSIIQAAIAMRDGSELLVFDRADLLTKKGRNGLFRLCEATGLRCLMLMSASSLEELPKLQGDNATLWLSQGMIAAIP